LQFFQGPFCNSGDQRIRSGFGPSFHKTTLAISLISLISSCQDLTLKWQLVSPGGQPPDDRSQHTAVWSPTDDGMYVYGGAFAASENDRKRQGLDDVDPTGHSFNRSLEIADIAVGKLLFSHSTMNV